jgi:hypothetical protein
VGAHPLRALPSTNHRVKMNNLRFRAELYYSLSTPATISFYAVPESSSKVIGQQHHGIMGLSSIYGRFISLNGSTEMLLYQKEHKKAFVQGKSATLKVEQLLNCHPIRLEHVKQLSETHDC